MRESFEVLIKPNKNINSWYWEKIKGNLHEYCCANPMRIVRHKKGYICGTSWNKKIGLIIDSIMKMHEMEFSCRFTGKISVLPTDYYVLNKVDPVATKSYVIVEL